MSNRVNSTDVRDNVRALLAAAQVVVDGYEQHIAAGIAQVRALLREAERWTQEGGDVPAVTQRYAELAVAYEAPCRCKATGRCSVCRALKTLAREFATPIELEVAALTAFQWMTGDVKPNLAAALAVLSEVLLRTTGRCDAAQTIMAAARQQAADCHEPRRLVA